MTEQSGVAVRRAFLDGPEAGGGGGPFLHISCRKSRQDICARQRCLRSMPCGSDLSSALPHQHCSICVPGAERTQANMPTDKTLTQLGVQLKRIRTQRGAAVVADCVPRALLFDDPPVGLARYHQVQCVQRQTVMRRGLRETASGPKLSGFRKPLRLSDESRRKLWGLQPPGMESSMKSQTAEQRFLAPRRRRESWRRPEGPLPVPAQLGLRSVWVDPTGCTYLPTA